MKLLKNLSKEQALNLAEYFVKLYIFTLDNIEDYPEDMWLAIAEDWDLNLWVSDDKGPCAAIYPVIHHADYDETDLSTWHIVIVDYDIRKGKK